MRTLKVTDMEELAACMLLDVDELKTSVCAIAKYEEAKDLVKELLMVDETSVANINIEDDEVAGYEDEFVVSLLDDYTLWCEKCKRDNGEYIVGYYDKRVYVMEDCKQSALGNTDESNVIMVSYDDCDCGECDSCDWQCVKNSKKTSRNGNKITISFDADTDETEEEIWKNLSELSKEVEKKIDKAFNRLGKFGFMW